MINKLEEIGFYTMTTKRCQRASVNSPMMRGELILSATCNFRCIYCRNIGGPDMPYEQAENIIKLWTKDNLRNIRFSGGEPTLYKGLVNLVKLSKELGVERIAISTNGSASKKLYDELLEAGVNDFSISLDSCCASDGDIMAGVKGQWDKVIDNIKYLSSKTYVTVGVVLTDDNADKVNDIITFADSLGVADIRIIPAAQNGDKLKNVYVSPELLVKYPILKYRIDNLNEGKSVRGLSETDNDKCPLVLDDSAICEGNHFPCIIYCRESGKPIGKVGPNMRQERLEWYLNHNTKTDSICSKNCLDTCREYNLKYKEFHKE